MSCARESRVPMSLTRRLDFVRVATTLLFGMRLLAPAKINLHLRVAPVGADGFHPVVTWMCTVALFDTLSLDRVDCGSVTLESNDASLPADRRNLVVRAAEAILSSVPSVNDRGGLHVRLEKRVPARDQWKGYWSSPERMTRNRRRRSLQRRSLQKCRTRQTRFRYR